MYAASLYHPNALPGYGTPAHPVPVCQMPGEKEAAFFVRVFNVAKHLATRSGLRNKYFVKLERIG